MKKVILVIPLILLTLVVAGSAIGCTGGTTTTTPTPAASQTMDLIGIWSGTYVTSGPGRAVYYNMVMNVTNQNGTEVYGTLAATVLRNEGQVVGVGSTEHFNGKVSGSTLSFMDQHVLVSGNSMTGSGTNPSKGMLPDWSYNLTRVR